MTNETVRKLAALATGIGSAPLSLRLFTILGVPVGGPGGDSVAPFAFWLASSSIAQVCAAALFVGGSVVWLAADRAESRLGKQDGVPNERDREQGPRPRRRCSRRPTLTAL
jgi:hypothetical protein